jgi:hypothetical protein
MLVLPDMGIQGTVRFRAFHAVLDIPFAAFCFGALCCSSRHAQFSFRTSSSPLHSHARIKASAGSGAAERIVR